MTSRDSERPVELDGVPDEEDVSTADASDRVDRDPDEQPNYTDQPGHPHPAEDPEQAQREPERRPNTG
jgi:hypothetical protein